MLERSLDFARSFDHYKKALELGQTGREMYLKLARMALDQLKDPAKAAPFAQWLNSRYGQTELAIAALYADVERQNGRPEESGAVYQRLASEMDPPPAIALAGLGRIQLDQGNFEQARDLLTRALELNQAEAKSLPDPRDSATRIDETEVRRLLDKAASQIAKPKEKEDASVTIGIPETAGDGNSFPARILSRTPIKYPNDARIANVEGTVVISFLIDEMGQVMKADIVSGDRRLAKAVLDAAKSWRFEPRLEHGRAVVSYFTFPVTFKIEKSGVPPPPKKAASAPQMKQSKTSNNDFATLLNPSRGATTRQSEGQPRIVNCFMPESSAFPITPLPVPVLYKNSHPTHVLLAKS